jgi:hypothetical protein
VVRGPTLEGLRIAAAFGLPEPAQRILTEAMHDPSHPIAWTFVEPVPTIDVSPTRPGGPALRSHAALTMTRDGATTVVGVLALAHEAPLGADALPVLQAATDLAAVAVERQ